MVPTDALRVRVSNLGNTRLTLTSQRGGWDGQRTRARTYEFYGGHSYRVRTKSVGNSSSALAFNYPQIKHSFEESDQQRVWSNFIGRNALIAPTRNDALLLMRTCWGLLGLVAVLENLYLSN